jgi:NADH-quinone oxidoreductase subunit C
MRLLESLQAELSAYAVNIVASHGEFSVQVNAAQYLSVCERLRDAASCKFDVLIDLCGVDYLGFGEDEWETDAVSSEGFSRGIGSTAESFLGSPGRFAWQERPRAGDQTRRFAVVVHLLSVALNQRVRVKVFCEDSDFPTVPSVTGLWSAANWFEREAFDLFGIVFDSHPDLRRILTDYGFIGHPFRKDFPLIGNVEVRYDEAKGRVVYEPVTIDPRVGVPRVVREDSRYEQAHAEAASKSPARQ